MKTVLSYISILSFTLLYTLFLDGETGTIVLAFFLIAPIISAFLTLVSKSGFKIKLDINDDCINKLSKVKVQLTVRKKRIFPTPLITIKLKTSLHFAETEFTSYRFSLAEAKEYMIEHKLEALIGGTGTVKVEKAFISDYLGVFKFNLIKTGAPEVSVYIKPYVPQISDTNALFKAVSTAIFSNEDDEEAAASVNYINSMPGYEYREYIPGDSLKKINWKLSMKKSSLYVRLDESAPRNKPIILIDFLKGYDATDDYDSLIMYQRIIEGALAMLLLCIKQGVECFLGYRKDKAWKMDKISTPEDVYEAAIKIGNIPFEFADKIGMSRLPDKANEEKKSSSVFLLYTIECNSELYREITASELRGNIVNVIDVKNTKNNNFVKQERLWRLMEDYEVKAALE